VDLAALEQALRQGHWREANELTQMLLTEMASPAEQVRRIDALWQVQSGGRFGFAPQYQVWTDLGGPSLEPSYELWEFFDRFGDAVGWRRGGHWACWAGVIPLPEDVFPTLEVGQGTIRLPRGCSPFMTSCPRGTG
jgi:hypothetical protein